MSFTDVYFVGANFVNNTFIKCKFISGNFNAHFYNARFDKNTDVEYLKKYIPMVCPETGSFIAYKKAILKDWGLNKDCIVKLLIPDDARRSSATTRECRADKAVVLEIQDMRGNVINVKDATVHSKFRNDFTYSVGDNIFESKFDTNRFNECAVGIHFFITRQEAVEFNF